MNSLPNDIPSGAPSESSAKPGKPDLGAILRKARKHLPLILCALAALLALSLCIYFIVGPAEGYFHADCTDSLLWAEATYDAGRIFNPDFNYAALLPFGASLWLVPLIAVFGVTMTTHVIGMVIFALLFLASIIVLCRKMKWSYAAAFGTSALLLLILSSSEKLREIMWNHVIYYSLGLLLYFFALALTFFAWEALERADKKPVLRFLPLAGLFVFVALSATNGFQMLVLTVVPVCAGVFLERLFDRETPLASRKNIPPLLVLVVSVAGVLIGTVILKSLLGGISSGYATAYSRYSSTSEWASNLDKFFMNWLTLLGMDVAKTDELFTLDSIVNILRIGVSLLLLVVPLVGLCCYKRIDSRYTRVLLIGHTFLLAFLFFGCVCGRLAAANWRLVPLVGSAILTTVALVREAWTHRKTAICTVRGGVLVLVVLALLSSYNAKLIADMPFDYGRDNELHRLAERLESEGLSYGYATFWRSQSITLLSDSAVKCREILVKNDKDDLWGITTDHYQSSLKWYEDQEGVDEYFVLLSGSEYQTIALSDYWVDLNKRAYVRDFMAEGYYVFVFSENIWGAEAEDRIY